MAGTLLNSAAAKIMRRSGLVIRSDPDVKSWTRSPRKCRGEAMSSGHNNRSQRIPLIVASEPDNVGVTLGTGPIERRLAAFLALDIKDYAAMISRDEAGAHRRVGRDLVIVVRQIHKQAGRILQFTGDGLLAEFSSATATLKAGLSIQASSRSRNRRR